MAWPEVTTVSALFVSDSRDQGQSLTKAWFRSGWSQLGYELAQWFESAESRVQLAGVFPHGARLEGFDDQTGTSSMLTDQDLRDEFWDEFFGRAACASESGVLAFKCSDDWIPVNNVSSPLKLSLNLYRPAESMTVLTAHANMGLFLSPERQGKTIRLLYEIGSLFDPAYAEIAYTPADDGLTAMDYARNVFGDPQYPMDKLYGSARTVLRGYGWVTVVPKELASMVTDLDAFFKADLLPSGALWLQATHQFADYDHAAAQRVSAALRPVLPDVRIDRGLAERVRIAIGQPD